MDGPVATPPHWPSDTTIVRSAGHATVLLFVDASCADDSLRSLARALAVTGESLEAHVLVSGPAPEHLGGRPEVWDVARAIRGVRVVTDSEEIRRFGALSRGRVLVYDANGRLGYQGPIGPSSTERVVERRADSIANLTMSSSPSRSIDPGCALTAPPFGEWP